MKVAPEAASTTRDVDTQGLPEESLLIEELTWPEIGRLQALGYDTVIVPCGAIEQHGPHMALVADSVQARAVALLVAQLLGRTLVAPVIPVGCSDHHLGLPGTISLRRETLQAIYLDYCQSLTRHGFRRIGCLSAHGGNFNALAEMLPSLRRAIAPAEAAAFTDLDGYIGAWRTVVAADRLDVRKVGGHADIAETSIVLSLRPDLVRPNRLGRGFIGSGPNVRRVMYRDGIQALSPTGVLGDSRGANAALGQACLERVSTRIAMHFQSAAAWS